MFNEDADKFEKKISLKFLQTLNRHLPVKRKTLKELLLEDKPCIQNRDGSIHSFERKELEKIASMISEWDYERLRLPIYLEMSSSMERGAIKISGRIESGIIYRVLHGNEKEQKKIPEKDSLIIYYPQLRMIRRQLSTTTQFMFTM